MGRRWIRLFDGKFVSDVSFHREAGEQSTGSRDINKPRMKGTTHIISSVKTGHHYYRRLLHFRMGKACSFTLQIFR